VRFATAIGRSLRGNWKRAAGAGLTILTLSAVAVVGLALFGSDVLASWKTPGNAEPALASANAFEGLLTLEAPTATVSRFEATTKEAQRGNDLVSNAPLLVKNWKPTQLSIITTAFQFSFALYMEAFQLSLLEAYLDTLPFVPQQQVDQAYLTFYNALAELQALVDIFIPPALRPPTIPPASPNT
jgi:hypothetical protein